LLVGSQLATSPRRTLAPSVQANPQARLWIEPGTAAWLGSC